MGFFNVKYIFLCDIDCVTVEFVKTPEVTLCGWPEGGRGGGAGGYKPSINKPKQPAPQPPVLGGALITRHAAAPPASGG